MSDFDAVWNSIDSAVAAGHMPGAVAGVRRNGVTEFHAAGFKAFGSDEPMQENTQFRIASLSKLIAGALGALVLDEGLIALDDPVSKWLPEFSEPRVLIDPAGPLDSTVPAVRPITVQQLFTFTMGIGVIFEPTPLSEAVRSAGIGASIFPPDMTGDEYLAKLSALPLAHQPGERWMYNTSGDVFSALVARAAKKSLGELLREKITGPLEMNSTGFSAMRLTLPPSTTLTQMA
ncbi:beta-lactamase family protein [Renibacterium salmoninarum ATCC 33209]|uniref:Beta-lactamase family protein n=1 Tax=Renibacterium salmoninarum (strain ATCC 33209 / DSM 20767 / JCM 11484 / NBRC 15589 / NCIMB 2235) TaxID=288705 RepID=A9WQM1_RENSM|nr:serine hydrolase domain-containing protein [Renibacterium salmoninarum]ABY22663.1 beta-lactamase family protein [Renibacterium salmoninarum ATCC 33209]